MGIMMLICGAAVVVFCSVEKMSPADTPHPPQSLQRHRRSSARLLSSVAFVAIAISAGWILPARESLAQSWNGAGTPPTNYNEPTNWTPNGVPGFTATFGASSYYGTQAAPITGNVIAINTWDFSTAPQTYYLTITGNSNNFSGLGVVGSNANITNNAATFFGNP